MEFKDKIYFLDDVLDEYERRGGDRETGEAIYWYFHDTLKKDIEESDDIVYKIPNFGTLYFTQGSLYNIGQKLEGTINKYSHLRESDKQKINKRQDIVKSKLMRMRELIDKAVSLKVNNIWFLRNRFNPKNIKNG